MSLKFILMNNEAESDTKLYVLLQKGSLSSYFSLFDCKPISVRSPLPVPGSLTGANTHHAVRTDEHRPWQQQLL